MAESPRYAQQCQYRLDLGPYYLFCQGMYGHQEDHYWIKPKQVWIEWSSAASGLRTRDFEEQPFVSHDPRTGWVS